MMNNTKAAKKAKASKKDIPIFLQDRASPITGSAPHTDEATASSEEGKVR